MQFAGLWRVLLIAPLSYVAIGSTIATFVLDETIRFWEGMLALTVPLALQFGIAWISSHSKKFEKTVKQHPAMLLLDGEMLPEMMHHEMITDEEVREAARKAGMTSLQEAQAIVLEVDGTISVVRRSGEPHPRETSTLKGVKTSPKS